MFWGLLVFEVAKSVTWLMYKVSGEKNRKFYFCFIWFKNDFKRVLDEFWRLLLFEVAKSVTWLMFKVWGKKIENFYFVSYALIMILKGFWMCFGDFWFSRSPNPTHDPCIRYGAKKIENFYFVSYALIMILKGFWMCFGDFWFSR